MTAAVAHSPQSGSAFALAQWFQIPADASGADDDLVREEILAQVHRFSAYAVAGDDALLVCPGGRCLVQERGEATWFDWVPVDRWVRIRFWMNTSSVVELFQRMKMAENLRRCFEELYLNDPPQDLSEQERWAVYDAAAWVGRPYVRRMAKGRCDAWWGRHVEQCMEVLGAAVRGTTSIRGAELARDGWAAEAQVAELIGQLARAAWSSRRGNTAHAEAQVLGRELTRLGHGPLAVEVWKAVRVARADHQRRAEAQVA